MTTEFKFDPPKEVLTPPLHLRDSRKRSGMRQSFRRDTRRKHQGQTKPPAAFEVFCDEQIDDDDEIEDRHSTFQWDQTPTVSTRPGKSLFSVHSSKDSVMRMDDDMLIKETRVVGTDLTNTVRRNHVDYSRLRRLHGKGKRMAMEVDSIHSHSRLDRIKEIPETVNVLVKPNHSSYTIDAAMKKAGETLVENIDEPEYAPNPDDSSVGTDHLLNEMSEEWKSVMQGSFHSLCFYQCPIPLISSLNVGGYFSDGEPFFEKLTEIDYCEYDELELESDSEESNQSSRSIHTARTEIFTDLDDIPFIQLEFH